MIPIHELLARIRWDPEFGQGRFELGYLDRVQRRILRVPLCELQFEPGRFRFAGPDGSMHEVPFHRVREVYRDGALIWHREGSPAGGPPR